MASLPSVSPFLVMFSMLLLTSCSVARELLVGGSEDSWKVPLPSPDSLNQWAKSNRFRIGDALNPPLSVLLVKEEDYARCNTSGPHSKFNDGNTKVVMSSRHGGRFHSLAPSPSPVPPNNQGVARSSGGGFIGIMMGLAVSLVMMFLI